MPWLWIDYLLRFPLNGLESEAAYIGPEKLRDRGLLDAFLALRTTRAKICLHSRSLQDILLTHAFIACLIYSICSSFVHRAGVFAASQDKNTGHCRMAADP